MLRARERVVPYSPLASGLRSTILSAASSVPEDLDVISTIDEGSEGSEGSRKEEEEAEVRSRLPARADKHS